MKRLFSLIAVLMVAAPLFALDQRAVADPPRDAQRVSIVDEVIRMSTAGVADEQVVGYIRSIREPFYVTSDDLIALANARVSSRVVRELQNQARLNEPRDRRAPSAVVVAAPYPYYAYGYPYYDPFWYGPRLSFGLFIGPRYRGGFRQRW